MFIPWLLFNHFHYNERDKQSDSWSSDTLVEIEMGKSDRVPVTQYHGHKNHGFKKFSESGFK